MLCVKDDLIFTGFLVLRSDVNGDVGLRIGVA